MVECIFSTGLGYPYISTDTHTIRAFDAEPTVISNEFPDLIEMNCITPKRAYNSPYTFINSQNQTSIIHHFCISFEISNKLIILDDGDNLLELI